MKILIDLLNYLNYTLVPAVYAQTPTPELVNLPFNPPTITFIVSFFIRAFFAIAAIAALVYLLLGAFSWVTSGGDKESVKKAQDKIQAAIIGLILIVAVLAIMVTLEQFVFRKQICVGLTCDIKIPELITPK